MITNFKLFLENNNANEYVEEVSEYEYYETFEESSVSFGQSDVDVIIDAFRPYIDIKYTPCESDATNSMSFEYRNINLYIFIDTDYYMWVKYCQESPNYQYHKIDIANGYEYTEKYCEIINITAEN